MQEAHWLSSIFSVECARGGIALWECALRVRKEYKENEEGERTAVRCSFKSSQGFYCYCNDYDMLIVFYWSDECGADARSC